MEISTQQIKELRDETGAGILDCRKALQDANGDFDQALEYLREKGLATALKRSDRETSEGYIELYSHGDGRVGVMVEVNCETDFVARSEAFRTFVHEIALQIAAGAPLYVSLENVPEEVIKSMRAYFTAMQKAIRMHQGLVLQYVGDEIEAVFGVPLGYADHADKAVLAALEMRKRLEELNSRRKKEGKAPFRHGIGIHTGIVLAGNTGSQDRLSYALIGDTVNLASRIEQLTKAFRCDILVGEETVKRLELSFQMKAETPQKVKGYSRPLTVYRVLD